MKPLFNLCIPLFLLAGVISCQYFFDQTKARATYSEPLVLTSDTIKYLDLGLHNAAADLAWLASIQYLGGSHSKDYSKMDDYLSLASDLDKKFSYPYAFGALMLPSIGQIEEGITLAKKGLKESDPDWRIPYYLAITYHLNKEDRKSAAEYFDLAANTHGAPENIKVVAANYGSRPDLREQTKLVWISIIKNSDDEVVVEKAKAYLTHYEILDLLEKAASTYKERNHRYPEKVEDLVSSRILTAIPPDPFGLKYSIDEEGRAQASLP